MNRFSLLAFLFSGVLLAASALLYFPKWQQPYSGATLSWDVSGYYFYLPAALIYKDIKQLKWWGAVEEKYRPDSGMGQAFQHPSGNWVMKYPMGQALQFLPWFAVAHLLAGLLGYPADGFSLPYQAAISWGSLLVALIGLWYLRRVLKMYFPDRVVAAVLVCLVFGTNYLEYASITGAMTHNWLFTLYAMLIFSTIRFYQKPSFAWAASIGLLVGWATLTRPTEIISAIIPLLWSVGSWAALRGRLIFFKNHLSKIILAAAVAGAVMFLQPAYWKYATGDWIVYSYQEQGFSWLHPHLTDVLFSAKAGWLVYSPMMLFAVVGFFFLGRRRLAGGDLLPAILIYCLLALYITAAWNIWWYGGSLGQRAMVQSYPLWAFPLAAFVVWVSERKWRRWLFVPLAGMCIYLNLWWSHQAHEGGLFVGEQMTGCYMLKILGRFESKLDWLKLLDTNEEFKGSERRNVREVFFNNFENDTTGVTTEAAVSGIKSLILNGEKQFSPTYIVYAPPANPDTMPTWVRTTVTVRCDQKEWNWWQMTKFAVRFKFSGRIVKERMIRLQRHVYEGDMKTIFFDTVLPDGYFDYMEVFFWNAGSDKTIRLDDLKVETFE